MSKVVTRDEFKVMCMLNAHDKAYGSEATDLKLRWIVEGKTKFIRIDETQKVKVVEKPQTLEVDETNYPIFVKNHRNRVMKLEAEMNNLIVEGEYTFTKLESLRRTFDALLHGDNIHMRLLSMLVQMFEGLTEFMDEYDYDNLSASEFKSCIVLCSAFGMKKPLIELQKRKRSINSLDKQTGVDQFDRYGLSRKKGIK